MQSIRNEWARLNPKFVREEDGFWATIRNAAREAWHGYFAPLLLIFWMLKQTVKQPGKREA